MRRAHEDGRTHVLLERTWEPPLTKADLKAMIEAPADCMELHRVAWLGSMLSSDGRYLVCHFTAPDAESARLALRQKGADITVMWPGTVHDAPEAGPDDCPGADPGADAGGEVASANVLVCRRFDAPVALDEVQAREDAAAGCLDRHRVRFVRTLFSLDRRRMLCLYAAPDAESVRLAQREAGMPVERVWAVSQYRP